MGNRTTKQELQSGGNRTTKQGLQSNNVTGPPLGILLTGMYSSGVSTISKYWRGQGKFPREDGTVRIQTAERGFTVKSADDTSGFLISSQESGGRWSRHVWRDHIDNLDAIVFVIDSKLAFGADYARHELKRLLGEELLRGLPLLVLCNMQDLPKAHRPDKIIRNLTLPYVKDRPWKVLGCVATRGQGLNEGMEWLVAETAKRRAIPAQLLRPGGAKSDTVSETSLESLPSMDPDPTTSATRGKSRSTVASLLGYEPTSKTAGSTLGHFQPIRQGTECPFAKASKLWGGRPDVATLTLEDQAKANVEALIEFTRRSNVGENLDGFCMELADPKAGKTPEDLGSAVRRVLTALSDLDPSGEGMMKVKYIGSRGWRFRFAKADFFVTTFAPCYPATSSRYAFGIRRAFVLLQPELSFARHKLPPDTPHTHWDNPQTVRDKTRAAFRKAGREYYIPDTVKYPAAEHIVKPLKDEKGAVIRWWKEEDPVAASVSVGPMVSE